MLDFIKHIILPAVPCGHFALGFLSETCFKDAVFNLNARQKIPKLATSKKCTSLLENENTCRNKLSF